MNGDNRIYFTTPIYYVNAKPHLGHTYTSVLCDAARRYYQIMGYDTYYLTGTDEHGEKIMLAAREQGKTEQQFTDEVSATFRNLWPRLDVRPDDFIRTTDARHKRVVQSILMDLYAKEEIYKASYEGQYCVQCERYYTEKELEEAKPNTCPIHEVPLQTLKEENYFFRMSKYQDWLREKLESEPDFINPPQFANEVLGILREPLDDLCISRPKARVSWGIELPFDSDYVVYVWFDALVNYLSALGFPDGNLYKEFWPTANHVIAKDILRPHAVYWPTMLRAMGIPTYNRLHVHGYWQSGGKKMSKSLGNVIDPVQMAEKYGADALRYFILREMTLGSDGDFTESQMIKRYNSDLANDFGNLVSRVAAMIQRYFEGVIPQPGELAESDDQLLGEFDLAREALPAQLERLRLSDAIETVLQAVRSVNRYVDYSKPWDLAKKDRERLATVLFTSAQAAVAAAGLLWPVMPQKCDEAFACFGIDASTLTNEARWNGSALVPGLTVSPVNSLFPRRDKEVTPAPKQELQPKQSKSKTTAQASGEVAKGQIQYDDFVKVDLRVATILEAERHPNADKLMRLTVDLGAEKRQIIAGIAQHYTPEDLIGQQVIVVANLAPRNLRGLESHGMLLAAHDPAGLRLITPSDKTEPGASVS